jgi:class 3 adenylate cyclase
MGRLADRRYWAQRDLGMAMSKLPSGTVTFLFTDIEGSTALWERDRAAMAAAVERHLALLRAAITAHGGVPFKTVGDAVQAAFPTAPGAVAAAVAAQQAFAGRAVA